MIIVKKFNDVSELQKLQRIACSVPEDVYLHSMDDSIMVDAKSFINLFTLDFSEPVKIVTESRRGWKGISEALRRTPDPKSNSRRGWFDTSPAVFF